jgi:hypothetical protein
MLKSGDVMHLCTCEIAVGGDIRNTVVKDEFDPVTYPETEVLKLIHGAGAVSDVEVCGEVDRDPGEEKARLIRRYPGKSVEALFPGTKPPMETEMRGTKAPPKKKKKAPAKKRAREDDGGFKADDPSTPEVNEAFEEDDTPFAE